MEKTTTAQVKVAPRNIGLLNQCLQKARRVAVRSIDPIYMPNSIPENDEHVIEALNLSLEGPPRHLSYIFRLLDDAGLKIS
jgi:hypothetical protein